VIRMDDILFTLAALSLPKDKFNAEWRKSSTIIKAGLNYVQHFIEKHYLKKRPAIVQLCLAMMVNNYPVGCILFSSPPREANKRYGGETWELSRLFLVDEIPKNAETWLIGKSVKYIKANHKNVQYLLSYADPSAGHAGTIYKAANWKSDGMTDDERKSPRCDYCDSRTGKKYGRRGNVPTDAIVERIPRISKHRFVLSL